MRAHCCLDLCGRRGYGNVGWHRTGAGGPAVPEAATPAMDALVASGVALERVYAFACCSPTRSSFISGRCASPVSLPSRPLVTAWQQQHSPNCALA